MLTSVHVCKRGTAVQIGETAHAKVSGLSGIKLWVRYPLQQSHLETFSDLKKIPFMEAQHAHTQKTLPSNIVSQMNLVNVHKLTYSLTRAISERRFCLHLLLEFSFQGPFSDLLNQKLKSRTSGSLNKLPWKRFLLLLFCLLVLFCFCFFEANQAPNFICEL